MIITNLMYDMLYMAFYLSYIIVITFPVQSFIIFGSGVIGGLILYKFYNFVCGMRKGR